MLTHGGSGLECRGRSLEFRCLSTRSWSGDSCTRAEKIAQLSRASAEGTGMKKRSWAIRDVWHRVLFAAACAMSASCDATCPAGTVQDGDLCKTVTSLKGAGNSAQAGFDAAGSRSAAASTPVVNPGANTPSQGGAGVTSGPTAGTGAVAAGSRASQSGPAGTPAPAMTAGANSSQAGSAARAAIMDAGMPSGLADSGALPKGDWFCTQVGESCSCIQGQGISAESCSSPKPPCCFTLPSAGIINCQCWPQASEECTGFQARFPEAMKLTMCPPS
jgi:hypothetical protein